MVRVSGEIGNPYPTFSPNQHGALGLYIAMSTAKKEPSVPGDGKGVSPAVRNVVRLGLSAKEYRVLQDIAVKRVPALQSKLPASLRDDPPSFSRHRHNLAAIRASLRVFVGSSLALKLAEIITSRLSGAATKYETTPARMRWLNHFESVLY